MQLYRIKFQDVLSQYENKDSYLPLYVRAPQEYKEKFLDTTKGIGNALSQALCHFEYQDDFILEECDEILEEDYTLFSWKILERNIPEYELDGSLILNDS